MNTYYVNGIQVSREKAVAHWHRSRTYRMAKRRGRIFLDADLGDNSSGQVDHLSEAGIEIVMRQPFDDEKDGAE